MQVELIQNGRVLRQINHEGQGYIEAPPEGTYEIRLTNNSPHRRLAVVTIDGVNINTGKDGSYEGSGYAMNAWQSFTLKGWLRSNSEAAAFEFKPNEASYAAGTGRGTKNTGVIGVAVFDEKPKPVIYQPPVIIKEVHHHHHDHWPRTSPFWVSTTIGSTSGDVMRGGGTFSTNTSFTPESSTPDSDDGFTLCADSGPVPMAAVASAAPAAAAAASMNMDSERGVRSGTVRRRATEGDAPKSIPRRRSDGQFTKSAEPSLDLGTGYGQRVYQTTTTVEFERATTTPAFIVTLRYAVTAKLREWGVPIPEVHVTAQAPAPPNPFPAASGYAQPPSNWRG